MTTPGHMKDSIALVMDDRILTGDILFLLDVRDPQELTEELGQITGVTNNPVTALAHRLAELDAHRNRKIVRSAKLVAVRIRRHRFSCKQASPRCMSWWAE
jgi:glyoxylase-like metal-dependent hydrolase (beta-lactamase superfamily II)